MGQNEITSSLKNVTTVTKKMFDFIEIVGKGGFGKVWKVELIKNKQLLALKEMSKTKIIEKKMLENVFQEKKILSSLYHPFLVNLYASFQDIDNLYMVMDYLPCSDLRFQLGFIKRFKEEQLIFLAGCVTLGLEHIHANGIIHRDIKPENIVVEEKGYFRITDFGIARSIEQDSYLNEISGTPGYIPPEVVNGQRVSFESDYFALGIILYELMTGERPYDGRNKKEMVQAFEKEDVKLTEQSGYSSELCDFVNKLLIKDNTKRLGRGGSHEIKEHVVFKDFNWKHLFHKTLRSPFVPRLYAERNIKKLQKKKSEDISKETNDSDHSNNKQSDSFQNNFLNYTFIHKPNDNLQKITFYNTKLKGINSLLTTEKNFKTLIATPAKSKIKLSYFKKTPIKLLSKNKTNISATASKFKSSSLPKYKCVLPFINNTNSNSTNSTIITNTSLRGSTLISPLKKSTSSLNVLRSYLLKSNSKSLKMNSNMTSRPKMMRRSSSNLSNSIFV